MRSVPRRQIVTHAFAADTASDDSRSPAGARGWDEDSVLMERLADGRQDALAVLYERHGADCYRLARHITASGPLAVSAGDGRLVETTPAGMQIAHRFLDKSGSPKGSGALFGLAVAPSGSGLYYVDDAVNTLRLLH